MFEKKLKKNSGEINPVGVHRNMRECTLEVNFEGLGWYFTVCSFPILLIPQVLEVGENFMYSLSAFLLFFGDKKEILKAL